MLTVSSFPMSPGDVKWGVLLFIFIGGICLYETWKTWRKYKETRTNKNLVGLVLIALFTVGMIPAEMILRSYTSAAIVLDEKGVWVHCRPMLKDQGLSFSDIASYRTTTLTELGGVGRRSGYSNGTERIGWFQMHLNERKVYVCATGDRVLLVEGYEGEIFLLAPPEMDLFLEEFDSMMNERGV